MNSQSPLIILNQVTLRVRNAFLFRGASWRILTGQHWAIVGPNGSGKTSLARALTGDVAVVGGSLTYPGINDPSAQIGYVSLERHRCMVAKQEQKEIARGFSGRFDDRTTVQQELETEWQGSTEQADALRYLLQALNLNTLMERPVHLLSTGEFRKLILAKTLVKSLRLLILDEPFDGLDTESQRQLNTIIAEWLPKKTHLIIITHRPAEIPEKVTHYLTVKDGNIVSQDTQNPSFAPASPPSAGIAAQAARSQPPITLLSNTSKQIPPHTPLIQMNNVSVSYGRIRILVGVDWQMKQAENWTIIGPNGSGKTTLLNLISGDHSQAYANDIHVFGRRRGSGETIWELKRHIGLVSSAFQLRYRKDVEVRDVILSGFYDSVGVYHQGTFEQMQMIAKWAHYLNLQHLSRRSFTTLSYGEQRMVLLARAMVKAPLLLILDEPCEGLDRCARSMMLSFIDAIGQYTGTHLLYVTHHHKERIGSMTHALHLHALSTGGYTADFTAL